MVAKGGSMIHDAMVEVTCDGTEGCGESVYVGLPYTYTTTSGAGGRYDDDEAAVNRAVREDGWLVSEDGEQHFCSEECKESAGNP
jgi:hypothetical protein